MELAKLLEVLKTNSFSGETKLVVDSALSNKIELSNFREGKKPTNPEKFLSVFVGRKYHLDKKGLQNVGLGDCIRKIESFVSSTEFLQCNFNDSNYNYCFLLENSELNVIGCFMWPLNMDD